MLKNKPRTKSAIRRVIIGVEKITGLKIISNNNYKNWLKRNTLTPEILESQKKESEKFKYKPLISIITPTYKTPTNFLIDCIESVLNQTYENWELVLVDDASNNKDLEKLINEYTKKDNRIKAVFNKKNLHIAEATNVGIKNSTGEYVAFLDHDDVLYPNALYEVVKSLNIKKHDFIYSDEDKLSENGRKRDNPFFKPDWSPDFLRSINYITHFTVIKKDLVNKVGGLDDKLSGAQDWDLFLKTTFVAKSIHHIPKVLYGWRLSSNSTAQDMGAKPYVVQAQKKALENDINRRGYKAIVLPSKYNKDYWDVQYELIEKPLVSIVIPSRNQYEVVKRCIKSILEKTTYKNYEIVLVDTGSDDNRVFNWYKELKNNDKINIVSWPEKPFSYARACNYGVKKAKGKYLIMLNNDTEVITPNWIELMLGDAQRPEVGTVGVRLYYPGNSIIQHAGVGIGLGGYAANILGGSHTDRINSAQILYGNNKRNVACSTAACIMLRKNLFNKVGGFDEKFSVTYNDVDLGLRILKIGYLNIYNPVVELTHYESISLGRPGKKQRDNKEIDKSKQLLKTRWSKYIKHDPYYNDNMSKDHADFTVN